MINDGDDPKVMLMNFLGRRQFKRGKEKDFVKTYVKLKKLSLI